MNILREHTMSHPRVFDIYHSIIFQVDMPVFFYIDPEFADDPKMEFINDIILSYTFFEAKEGLKLPIPTYVRPHTALM